MGVFKWMPFLIAYAAAAIDIVRFNTRFWTSNPISFELLANSKLYDFYLKRRKERRTMQNWKCNSFPWNFLGRKQKRIVETNNDIYVIIRGQWMLNKRFFVLYLDNIVDEYTVATPSNFVSGASNRFNASTYIHKRTSYVYTITYVYNAHIRT